MTKPDESIFAKLKALEEQSDELLKESERLENSQVIKELTAIVRKYNKDE